MVWITADSGAGRAAHLLWLPGRCTSKTTTFLWHSCLKSTKEECGENVPLGAVVTREERLHIWKGASKRLAKCFFTDLTTQSDSASGVFRSMVWLQLRWRVERVRDSVHHSLQLLHVSEENIRKRTFSRHVERLGAVALRETLPKQVD